MTTTMPREDESTQLAKRELARLEGKKSCIGFYDLEKTLGEGSFARVKAATHVLTGAKVAIKIVDKSKLNEDMAEKLRREVRIMKSLNHPHIVRLYEVIETQQEMFLVMEHAEGGELLDYLVAHGRMREKDARKMFRGIVSAIAYCHSKHVIHRDLKAENLLLDMGLNPKIADFGFSNIFSENGLLSTSCGTPAYAAPELFKGREYTGPEIDIWSLGVVLFVLICGGLPFTASTFAALKARVIAGAFTVPVFMSTSCEELVRKMLETDPAKRITMDGVLKSAWFNDGYSPMEPFDEATYAIPPERHAAILGCMEELGFSRDRVEQSLESGAFNHFYATYHLLATEITPRIQREATEKPISHKHLEVTERRAAALAAKASQAQTVPVYATAVAAAGGAAAPTSPSTAAVAAPSTERNVVKRARGYTVNAVDANRIRKEMAIRKPSPLVPQKSDVQGSAPTSPQEGSSVPTSPTSPIPSPPLSPVSQSPSTAEPMNKIPKTDKGRRARAISLQPRAQRPVLATLAPASPTTSTASTATTEAATTSNASPPPSPRDHHMEDATTSAITSKNAPHVSSPLNPKAATMVATLGGRPSQLRERRLSFKDKFKKTLGLSIKEPVTSAEPPEPKTVRFHFSMQTTSAKAPAEIVGQLERVLDSFNVAYERENFLFLARKGSVAFELEVCKLPRLALHGVRIKRLAGDSWEYKAVCTDILLNLRL